MLTYIKINGFKSFQNFEMEFTPLTEEPQNGIHPFRIQAIAQLLKDLSSDFSDNQSPLRQVIINTHSPVLVNEIVTKWSHDQNVSLWLTQLNTIITQVNSQRLKFKITNLPML